MTGTRDRLVTEAAPPCTDGHRHSRTTPLSSHSRTNTTPLSSHRRTNTTPLSRHRRTNTPPLSSHSLMISLGATAIPFRTLSVLILIPAPKVAPFHIRVAAPAVLAPTNTPTNTPTRPTKASPGPSPRGRSTSSSIKSRPPHMRPISLPTPRTRPVNLATAPIWLRGTRTVRA